MDRRRTRRAPRRVTFTRSACTSSHCQANCEVGITTLRWPANSATSRKPPLAHRCQLRAGIWNSARTRESPASAIPGPTCQANREQDWNIFIPAAMAIPLTATTKLSTTSSRPTTGNLGSWTSSRGRTTRSSASWAQSNRPKRSRWLQIID